MCSEDFKCFPDLGASHIVLCYAIQISACALNVTWPSLSVCVSGYSQGIGRTCQEYTASVLTGEASWIDAE